MVDVYTKGYAGICFPAEREVLIVVILEVFQWSDSSVYIPVAPRAPAEQLDVLPRSFPFVFSCLVQCKDRQIIPFLVLVSSLSGLDLSQSASLSLKIQGHFTDMPPVFSLLGTPGYPQRRKACCFLLGAPADSHQPGSLLLLQPATDI